MSPSNTAAWLLSEKEHPLKVQPAEYVAPQPNEVVVKNAALALNVVDWARQAFGNALFPWVKYPCVLGSDVAGEVTEVGSAVKSVKPGERVLGLAVGLTSERSNDAAFQKYTILPETLVSKIPSNIAYEAAAVIPLAVSTAACGLFQKDFLALDHPTAPARRGNGRTLLVWGGASSVGTNAIQLAVAAGYDVIATASLKNHEYLRKLGASQLFDYHSETVAADLVEAFKGRESVGALAIGPTVNETVVDIVSRIGGRRFVACANPAPQDLPEGVTAKFIFGSDLKDNEVGSAIFNDFIPRALADGTFVPSPPADVAGTGLESIQDALDRVKDGVSLKKYVITLE